MKEDFLKLYQDFEEARNRRQVRMFELYGINISPLGEPTLVEFIEWLKK